MDTLLIDEQQKRNRQNFMQSTNFIHVCILREYIIEMNWKKYKSWVLFKP